MILYPLGECGRCGGSIFFYVRSQSVRSYAERS
jgi:hypothetical protein